MPPLVESLFLIEEQIREARSHLDVDEVVCGKAGFHLFLGGFKRHRNPYSSADGEGRSPWQQFVTEDLGQEDVIGHILWFKEVATDGAVSAGVRAFP